MFELIDEEPPPINDFEVFIATDFYYVTCPLAECIETGRTVSVECYLTPRSGIMCPGMAYLDFHEFGFYFSIMHDWGSGHVLDVMDRHQAAQFLPENCQALVMQIASLGCQALLGEVRPDYLYRVTSEPCLPEKALRKHSLITTAAQAAGYHPEYEGTDQCGRRFWIMMPPRLALTDGSSP